MEGLSSTGLPRLVLQAAEKKSVSEKTGEISVAKNTSSTWPLELSVVECAFLPHNTKLSGENL